MPVSTKVQHDAVSDNTGKEQPFLPHSYTLPVASIKLTFIQGHGEVIANHKTIPKNGGHINTTTNITKRNGQGHKLIAEILAE